MVGDLLRILPEHDIYVEPFVGGGSLFFAKVFTKPAKKFDVISDAYCDLINFYKRVAKGDLRKCEHLREINAPKVVDLAKKIYKTKGDKNLSACEFLLLSKGSYSGMASSGGRAKVSFPKSRPAHNKTLKTVLCNLDDYEHALRKTKILCGDFKKIMRKYDSPRTVFYLDPPYYSIKKFYKQESVTPKEIKSVTDKIKGKMILSYNKHPEVVETFCNSPKYHCYQKTARYTFKLRRGEPGKYRSELIITNFKLKRR